MENKYISNWIDSTVELLNPNKIVWLDGTKEQQSELINLAVEEKIMIKLNEDIYDNCYYYTSNVNDVARVEGRTFICTDDERKVGVTNNFLEKNYAYDMLTKLFDKSMEGKTMYVIPFCMGPFESPFSKCGIQVTDSLYVAISMITMTRVGNEALQKIGETSNFVKCMHAVSECSEENRYICHFPDDNTIWSINSEYGGNALLGKKSFALRIASATAKEEGWLAEHMLTLGVEKPDGETFYVSAAFPSACGKTNFAMLVPPEKFADLGYKVWCVSDDITWIRKGEDGKLWGINPENGFFGVVPGTSMSTNPNAMMSIKKDTIFTNVAYDIDNNSVWWEGHDDKAPKNLLDWKGNVWNSSMGTKAAHPNSRFATPLYSCPNISPEVDSPYGVPISAILFGGRREKVVPLVVETKSWNNGVFEGSTLISEKTNAQQDKNSEVSRIDPMAMLPFCGYDIGDYFKHWINVGKELGDKKPRIYKVNWFRKDENGEFIWNGFGDNMHVLKWIIDRCENDIEANECVYGYVPKASYFDIDSIDGMTEEKLNRILNVEVDNWDEELTRIEQFYSKIGETVPVELVKELESLRDRVEKL